jgi:hypothetical protein
MRPPDRQKAERPHIPSWRIFRTWGGNKTFIGIVEASNQELAVKFAIMQFKITDTEHQKHLVAELRD